MCPSTEKGAEARERREGGADPSSSKGPGPRGGASELTPHHHPPAPRVLLHPALRDTRTRVSGHSEAGVCTPLFARKPLKHETQGGHSKEKTRPTP